MTSPDSTSTMNYEESHYTKAHADHVETMEQLKPTPSRFEKLNLTPETPVAGKLRWTFGNPAPIALAGFLLANFPASIDLMGWGGAGGATGNTSASIGAFFFLGAVLQFAGGIGEWVLGNTFPAVLFFSFGGFWAVFGATLTPFYNAVAGYDNIASAFDRSFAIFLIAMGIICFLYMIAAFRTNICLVATLFCFVITFGLLAASYFYGANGMLAMSNSTRIAGGAVAFAASMIVWYLWFSMILEAVDFPIVLPVGDLSKTIKGRSEMLREKSQREMV